MKVSKYSKCKIDRCKDLKQDDQTGKVDGNELRNALCSGRIKD